MLYSKHNSPRALLALPTLVCVLCHSSQALAAAEQIGPAAIYAGPVAITPTAGVEMKYRDNIYLQENNETDSWIYLVRPGIKARLQDRENLYQLSYKGEAGWYEESRNNDDNDYVDSTVLGDAHMEFSERWIADGYLSWADLHEDRGTGLSEGFIGQIIPEPIEYDQIDVGGSLQYGSDQGVGRLLLNAGYMDREYQNFRDLTRSRDREETTLGATFFYPVAPKTDVLVEYAYKDIEYPNPFEQIARLDSTENSLWAGAEWEITPNLTSTAKAGYIDKDFDDSTRKDWDGIGWSLELWMQPRVQDTIVVTGSRKPEETTLQGDFIKRETLKVDWTHNWSERVDTTLGGSIGRDTYEESINGREDDIYSASFTVNYAFRRWAEVYAGYIYDDKDSNADGLSYTDHTFKIGVDFSL
jgi:hypothetical protein